MPLVTDVLGSPAAIGIASAGAIGAAAVGAVVVGVVAYSEWTSYVSNKKNAKLRKAVNDVLKIYRLHLATVPVPSFKEVQGFPPPFKIDETNPEKVKLDSMHLTRDQIEDIAKDNSLYDDSMLAEYDQLIRDAILKIQVYYFSRHPSKDQDVTAGVLSYLLQMLAQKCLKFEGYAYDIAYLDALTRFLNDYMSLAGSEKTKGFSRLREAYGYLLKAKKVLEKHRSARSLEEMLTELFNYLKSGIPKAIRSLCKIIVPSKDWPQVKMTTLSDMCESVLHRGYTNTFFGIPYQEKEITVSHSLFQTWLSELIDYYNGVIQHDPLRTMLYRESPEELFILPDLEKMRAIQRKPLIIRKKEESAELHLFAQQMDSMRKIFKQCDNFVTMKLGPGTETNNPKFIHVAAIQEVYDRSKNVVVAFVTAIHKAISLLSYGDRLLQSVRQLGEIYVKNQSHFVFIFSVLQTLCDQINVLAQEIREAIEEIQEQNGNVGRLAEQESFPLDLLAQLDSLKSNIKRLGERIEKSRLSMHDDPSLSGPTFDTVRQQMLADAEQFADIYNMPHTLPASPGTSPAAFIQAMHANGPHRIHTSVPHQNFWQRHRYKIFVGILIGTSVLAMLVTAALTCFSGGLLSLVAAMLGGLGIKTGATLLALAGIDGLLGFAGGAMVGSLVGGTILAMTEAKDRYNVDYRAICDELNAITPPHEKRAIPEPKAQPKVAPPKAPVVLPAKPAAVPPKAPPNNLPPKPKLPAGGNARFMKPPPVGIKPDEEPPPPPAPLQRAAVVLGS